MNTRAAGRGTTTAGIAATTDAVTTVAAAGERGRQGTTRGVIYQPGSTLTKSATFPENRTTSVSRSLTGSSTVPVHREGGSRQRMSGPSTMSHPALWTCPACGRPLTVALNSGGRRGGRPQAVGNLAGERRRPCLRTGREIPTVPQRIIIDNRIRTGLVPTMATAGQCRSRGRRGRAFAIGIHLNQALELSKPPGPRQSVGEDHCGHLQVTLAGGAVLPVDQAEPEGEELRRNVTQRSDDAGLDCDVHIFDPVVPQVCESDCMASERDSAASSAQPVRAPAASGVAGKRKRESTGSFIPVDDEVHVDLVGQQCCRVIAWGFWLGEGLAGGPIGRRPGMVDAIAMDANRGRPASDC